MTGIVLRMAPQLAAAKAAPAGGFVGFDPAAALRNSLQNPLAYAPGGQTTPGTGTATPGTGTSKPGGGSVTPAPAPAPAPTPTPKPTGPSTTDIIKDVAVNAGQTTIIKGGLAAAGDALKDYFGGSAGAAAGAAAGEAAAGSAASGAAGGAGAAATTAPKGVTSGLGIVGGYMGQNMAETEGGRKGAQIGSAIGQMLGPAGALMGGTLGAFVGDLFDDPDAARTGRMTTVAPGQQLDGWGVATSKLGTFGITGGKWFDESMRAPLEGFNKAVAAADDAVVNALGLSPAELAKAQKALGSAALDYSFGMERTPTAVSPLILKERYSLVLDQLDPRLGDMLRLQSDKPGEISAGVGNAVQLAADYRAGKITSQQLTAMRDEAIRKLGKENAWGYGIVAKTNRAPRVSDRQTIGWELKPVTNVYGLHKLWNTQGLIFDVNNADRSRDYLQKFADEYRAKFDAEARATAEIKLKEKQKRWELENGITKKGREGGGGGH